jgi:hypothetical protein
MFQWITHRTGLCIMRGKWHRGQAFLKESGGAQPPKPLRPLGWITQAAQAIGARFMIVLMTACSNGTSERPMNDFERLHGQEIGRAQQLYAQGHAAEGRDILRRLMAHDDWNVRSHAVGIVGNVRDTALLPEVHTAISDESFEVRARASQVLQDLGTESSLSVLTNALRDPEPIVRSNAAGAVARIANVREQETLERLMLQDPDSSVRAMIAFSLGDTGNPIFVPALELGLRDRSSIVRAHAATALGQIGSRRAEPALRAALKDPDAQVRRSAERALRQLQ